VNIGAIPEAPLGAHTTQFVPVPRPLPARAPEAERPLSVVAAPLEEAALDARTPPPAPPPAEPIAAPPPVLGPPWPDVGGAEFVRVEVRFAAVPTEFPAVPVAEGAMVGSTTAPPPAG
jgi:hypothetical protein